MKQIKIGVSSCLLGETVRYDGGHKLDSFVVDVLGAHLTLVSLCPEVGAGMGVPREPMHLEGDPDHPFLVTNRSAEDKTEQLLDFAGAAMEQLRSEEISGFILKKNSPSCGLFNVPVHDCGRKESGRGLFARELTETFSFLPVEEEEGLKDLPRRESFIERVFAYRRWRDFAGSAPDLGALVQFHTAEKLVVMSHSVKCYQELGGLVAKGKEMPWPSLLSSYQSQYFSMLELKQTTKKHTNVLQHAMGYFKDELGSGDKEELLHAIMQYHDGRLPLLVPLTLLRHDTLKYRQQYLAGQRYLFPHPAELMLRYHA